MTRDNCALYEYCYLLTYDPRLTHFKPPFEVAATTQTTF